ncbi:MAG: hypothetical protein AcusKO_46530 [Acuticoccus sp.]
MGNIHRRGAITPTVTLSLGLSLTLLVTLSLVDGNLRQTLLSRMPAEAPSFFFVDIQDAERDAFVAALDALAPTADVRSQPMLRGRIVSSTARPAPRWPDTEASWVLRGDRGITYDQAVPEGSEIVAGQWWPAEGGGRRTNCRLPPSWRRNWASASATRCASTCSAARWRPRSPTCARWNGNRSPSTS